MLLFDAHSIIHVIQFDIPVGRVIWGISCFQVFHCAFRDFGSTTWIIFTRWNIFSHLVYVHALEWLIFCRFDRSVYVICWGQCTWHSIWIFPQSVMNCSMEIIKTKTDDTALKFVSPREMFVYWEVSNRGRILLVQWILNTRALPKMYTLVSNHSHRWLNDGKMECHRRGIYPHQEGTCTSVDLSVEVRVLRISFSSRSALTFDFDFAPFVWLRLF